MLHNNIDNNIFFIKKNVVINILRFFWKSKMHHEHDTNTIIKITNIKKSQTCYKKKEKKGNNVCLLVFHNILYLSTALIT